MYCIKILYFLFAAKANKDLSISLSLARARTLLSSRKATRAVAADMRARARYSLLKAANISLYHAEYKLVHALWCAVHISWWALRRAAAAAAARGSLVFFTLKKKCYRDKSTNKFGFFVIHGNGYTLESSIYVLCVRPYRVWQNSVRQKVSY